MLTRFFSALIKLGRISGSSEFTAAHQMKYILDPQRLLEDEKMLRTWAGEIGTSARLAHSGETFDYPSLLVVENLVLEFNASLDEAVAEKQAIYGDDSDFEDEDFLDEEPFHEGFYNELIEDLTEEEGEILADAFWDIIDANFEHNPESCDCAECTAAEDFKTHMVELESAVDVVAKELHSTVKEAFMVSNTRYSHPALRNDPTPEQYAETWCDNYRTAVSKGSYELAKFVSSLEDMFDDAVFALIAQNAQTVESFTAKTAKCLANTGSLLARV